LNVSVLIIQQIYFWFIVLAGTATYKPVLCTKWWAVWQYWLNRCWFFTKSDKESQRVWPYTIDSHCICRYLCAVYSDMLTVKQMGIKF